MKGIAARVDAALTAPGPWYRLREVQTLVALVVGWRLITRDWTRIADRAPALTEHRNVMAWYPGAPPAWLLVALQIIGIGAVALVVARRRPRLAFAVAWATYVALCAWWGASGKVMHNDVLTATVAFPLLFARPAARGETGWAVRWGWPPRAALAVMGTVYFLTGFQKLRHAGLDWVFSDNMAWVLRQGAVDRAAGLATFVADHAWLAQGLAGGALALELTAPLWLAIRPTRALFAVAALVMHTSIWLLLGIDYSAWVLTVAAVTVPMSLRADRPLFPGPRSSARRESVPAPVEA
ncbi:MAG TPA: hypothetical protein VNR62_01980 [Cellulomonas sp.]|nr:hypothetical protein [Cellulomonas sp.]